VFIVHGHDVHASKNELANFIWRIGLEPIIPHEHPKGGRVIIDQFEKHAANVEYAFVLFTPDDIDRDLQTTKIVFRHSARQNVILEMSYFMGKLGRERICCLVKGEVEPSSDIHGILFLKYNQKVEDSSMLLERSCLTLVIVSNINRVNFLSYSSSHTFYSLFN